MTTRIDFKDIEIKAMSGVDSIGIVFIWNDRIFRAIRGDTSLSIQNLFSSGLIGELVDKHLFPKSWATDYELEGYHLVIEHSKIDPIVYPFEWSFEMLKDAALAILEVNEIAVKYSFILIM